MGDNFKATLRDLEARMRKAAADLESEEAARLRDKVKRLNLMDLEFANDAMTGGRGDGGPVGGQTDAGGRCEAVPEGEVVGL